MIVNRRNSIRKSNGSLIRTDYFTTDEYSEISGVIFSSVDISNINLDIGYDMILIKNPYASKPIKKEFDRYKFFRMFELVEKKLLCR